MPQSRTTRLKNQLFQERGKPKSSRKKDDALGVGPVVIGFFLFVVVGSGLKKSLCFINIF